MTGSVETISPSQLPEVIAGYLIAHAARDLDAAVSRYTEDATVVDEAKTYRGPQQIRAWLDISTSEYTYTLELIGARRVDDAHYVAIEHLEGNFPGGSADLDFTFTLKDDMIVRLAIT